MGLNTNTIHIIKLILNEPIYSTFLHVVTVQAHLQEEAALLEIIKLLKKAVSQVWLLVKLN
jgi:predicted permease